MNPNLSKTKQNSAIDQPQPLWNKLFLLQRLEQELLELCIALLPIKQTSAWTVNVCSELKRIPNPPCLQALHLCTCLSDVTLQIPLIPFEQLPAKLVVPLLSPFGRGCRPESSPPARGGRADWGCRSWVDTSGRWRPHRSWSADCSLLLDQLAAWSRGNVAWRHDVQDKGRLSCDAHV